MLDGVEKEARYHPDAYLFVRLGLSKTMRRLGREKAAEELTAETRVASRHVTGQELAKGLRDIAKRRYGLLARTVLQRWGIYNTLDFGRVVYALIDAGLMSKSDEDCLDDFRDVYDFKKAFAEPARGKAVQK